MLAVTAGAHVGAAVAALLIGLMLLRLPKGTAMHRRLGFGYAGLVVLLDVAALGLHRQAAFGPFHALAILSLLTIFAAVGIVALTSGNRGPAIVAVHAYSIAWSYAGLVAAGVGQLTVQLRFNRPGWVLGAILGTLLFGGILIHVRMPRSLGTVLGGTQSRS